MRVDASIVQGAIAQGFISADAPSQGKESEWRKLADEKDAEIERLTKRAEDAEKEVKDLRAQIEALQKPVEPDAQQGAEGSAGEDQKTPDVDQPSDQDGKEEDASAADPKKDKKK